MKQTYKSLLLTVALLGTLCACGPKQEPPLSTPAPSPTVAPMYTPTPEIEADVVSETFRAGQYDGSPMVTVTVRYGLDDGPNTVTVEREGRVVQTITDEGGYYDKPRLTVGDMNFDGCLDFRYQYGVTIANSLEHCYLWDEATEQFILAAELDQLSDLSFDPETETVRAFERVTAWMRWDVLRWTDVGLVRQRRIERERFTWVEQKRDGFAYTIWDHDPTVPPLDNSEDCWTRVASFGAAVVEADPEGAQAEVERWLAPDYYGPDPAVPDHISPRLLDELTWRLNSGEDYHERVQALLDPLNALLDFDEEAVYQEYLLPAGYEGMRAALGGWAVDLDNDGVRDVLLTDDLGTGHFSSFYLLRGLEDGAYELTQSRPLNRGDWWWCINWEGSRYLVTYRSDHWARRLLGLDVYLFEDSQVKERAALDFGTQEYIVTQRLAADDYEWLAQRFETDGPAIWDQFQRDGKQICGSGERPATAAEIAALEDASSWYDYYVHDGQIYAKYDGGFTVSGRLLGCTDVDIPDQDKLGSQPQMLWYEQNPTGGTTQVVASCFGDGPVYFEAFEYGSRVARVVLEPRWEVRRHTWTQGVNMNFETANWNSWAWNGNLE